MEDDTVITLIGTRLARIGNEFIFNGPVSECEPCKLRKTCHNLNPGSRYKIVNLRNSTRHDCLVHEEGVYAVEVMETPQTVAIESRKAFNGSKIVYEKPNCGNNDCEMQELCSPPGIENGDKRTIVRVIGDPLMPCPRGRKLKLVELKR